MFLRRLEGIIIYLTVYFMIIRSFAPVSSGLWWVFVCVIVAWIVAYRISIAAAGDWT